MCYNMIYDLVMGCHDLDRCIAYLHAACRQVVSVLARQRLTTPYFGMAKANPTKQQWETLLGKSQREELVRLLMGARREWHEGHSAAVFQKVNQALRLLGEN